MLHIEGSPLHVTNQQTEGGTSNLNSENQHSQQSDPVAASVEAQQRRRIGQLEEQLEALKSGRAVKQRYGLYYTESRLLSLSSQAIEPLYGSRKDDQTCCLSV